MYGQVINVLNFKRLLRKWQTTLGVLFAAHILTALDGVAHILSVSKGKSFHDANLRARSALYNIHDHYTASVTKSHFASRLTLQMLDIVNV